MKEESSTDRGAVGSILHAVVDVPPAADDMYSNSHFTLD